MSEQNMHEIEESLERDRLALAESLVALRHRLSPSTLVAEGKEALMAKASPLVSQLDGVVRSQPVIAAVAGVALAALIFGRRAASDREAATVVPAMSGTRFEALTRWEGEGGPPAPEPVDPEEDWLHEARGVREKAKQMLRQIDDAARRGVAPAAHLAKHRAEVMSAMAGETRQALGKGLESLTGTAREQALQARERIYLGRVALAEKGREQMEARPLMVGALLAAAGAAVACLFPQTETEDRLLGETRDRLANDFTSMLKSEAMKASDLAQTLGSALKTDMDRAASVFTPSEQRTTVRHH